MEDRSGWGGYRYHLSEVWTIRPSATQQGGGTDTALPATWHAPALRKERRRFLFLFSDTGGGHRACAEAVREALISRYGKVVSVAMVDIFRELHRFPFDRFPSMWPLMIRGRGRPWGLFYRWSNRPFLARAAHTLFWPYVQGPLLTLLRRYPAEVVVTFHGLPNLSLLWARRRLAPQPFLVSVTQDLVSVHAAFFPPGFAFYFVPTEAARMKAIHWGAPPERVRAIGNPVRPAVVRDAALAQREARRVLGLEGEPWLLIVGSEARLTLRLVAQLARRSPDLRVAVITGRNEALRRRLQAMRLPLRLRVEGFVERMGLWLRAVDLVATKAGPNLLAELFVAGRPAVLYDAIPGQESGNVAYAVEGGAACWAPSPRLAAAAIVRLLEDGVLRRRMGEASSRLARPQAADAVAKAIYRLAEGR